MRAALTLAPSIDNYIHTHSGNSQIEIIGKLAIAKTILDSERRSWMAANPENNNINLNELNRSWYGHFFKYLFLDVTKSSLEDLFDNIAIISFNYDRTVEHALPHAISTYYDIPLSDAQQLSRKLYIFHPYGTVGDLPFRAERNKHISDFGKIGGAEALLRCAHGIRTFTQQIEDDESLQILRSHIQDSNKIVFLGFAFHELNLRLLKTAMKPKFRSILATTRGISDDDKRAIRQQLVEVFGKAIQEEGSNSGDIRATFSDSTCADFFLSHSRSLRQ